MKILVRLAVATICALGTTVIGSAPLGGCSAGDSTTGRRIVLDVRVAASVESKQFTNAAGWNVTITKAEIATGALYFYDGATIFSSNTRPSSRPRGGPRVSFGVKTAFAHPGHYVPGNAKGEMLTPTSADLLAGAALGQGTGVTGFVRSATFAFDSPAKGPVAGDLGVNVAVAEGSAAKGAETRAFRLEVKVDDVKDLKSLPQIEGCPFTETDMQGDGTVTITVKLPVWFDQAEFDAVPKSADGTPVVLGDGLTRNQIVRGLKAGLGYQFAYAPR